MEKKLFDLLAAALSAITLLTAWGIWLDDRRKRRRENAPAATSATVYGNTSGMQSEVDDLRNEVSELRRDVNTLQRIVGKLKDAVRTHRTKIRELLERLSDNTF